MTALITGTWTLISSSAKIVSGARRMTSKIQLVLQPGQVELSEGDRRRLDALHKRIETLTQPLNFLLLWSRQRDSFVQQVVVQTQELLSNVCDFIDKYFPQDNGAQIGAGNSSKSASNGACTIDSEQLEYYLRELEYACTSISMAMNIVRATEVSYARTACPALPNGGRGLGGVSPSALLRASRRIQDMNGRSGDLCACLGRLYVVESVAPPPRSKSVLQEGADASCGSWVPVLTLAAFKVVASTPDSKSRRKKYGIAIESRLPVDGKSSMDDCAGLMALSAGPDDPSAGGCCLNNSGTHNFPIEVALDARLVTTGALTLPVSDLGSLNVDELVLLWNDDPAGSSSILASGEGGDPVDTILLPEEILPEVAHRPLWDRNRPASPSVAVRPNAGTWYAFVFNGLARTTETRGESDMPISALDALYMARLCAYDGQIRCPSTEGNLAEEPPHVSSPDEVLAALLHQPEGVQLPIAAPGLPTA